ncbi:MAG: medium chain dehydrogenase/reductase family protein [Anaerolineae bacterium]|nr:medium chain dehydrogenase/reductase family protein [Anaerolineae bacterium]
MKTHQMQYLNQGGLDVIQPLDVNLPEPRQNEVCIQVIACGVAFADILMRLGAYPAAPAFPFTPGYDMVGRVVKAGAVDSPFTPGQCVAALTVTGSYATYINLPAAELVPVPEGADPLMASASILNYVTAWQMLHKLAQIQPGESILVHGAAGGVGTALLQLAKLSNLTVYATASRAKHDLLRSLNAKPIDYRNEDFVGRVLTETHGKGLDAVFDGVGGTNLLRSARVLHRGGRLISYGFLNAFQQGKINGTQTALTFLLMPLISLQGKKVRFYSIGDEKKKDLASFKNDLANIFTLLNQNKINPIIAAALPLDQAAEAQRLLGTASVSGKIILLCGDNI